MRKLRFLLIFGWFLAVFVAPVSSGQEYPQYRGYVNDFAGVIPDKDETTITGLAGELERKTTAQIAVVTVNSVKPETIEGYAVRLFEKWGIGQKGKDNGALILMAVNDRRVRIEVGYGLEGVLTDAASSRIIQQIMIPRFRQGNLSEGLTAGALAAANLIAGEYNVELSGLREIPSSYYQVKRTSPLIALLRALFLLIFFIMFFGLRTGLLFFWLFGSGRRMGGYWYGTGYRGNSGGFSGGFGGFGGGLSGGGGASGSW